MSSSSLTYNTSDKSSSSSSDTLHDRIAKCALHHYHQVLPSNNGGKPQPGREWTVYAAIVAVRSIGVRSCTVEADDVINGRDNNQQDSLWVISCATGSKCTSINSAVSSLPTLHKRDDGHADQSILEDATLNRDEMIVQSYKGMLLKDSHAEVLARRGLMARLWSEIKTTLTNIQKAQTLIQAESMSEIKKDRISTNLLEIIPAATNNLGLIQFRLKTDVTLHMYISDSPCGDATIYEIKKFKYASRNDAGGHCDECDESMDFAPEFETEINFTGAKIILTGNKGTTECAQPTPSNRQEASPSISSIITFSNESGVEECKANHHDSSTITVGREHVQMLGALRLKSSRSNIPSHLRSTSMSCSDKLVRWGVLGMQGSLLTAFIPGPICLSSVCVSRDPRSVNGDQQQALDRALRGRIQSILNIMQRTQRCLDVIAPVVAIVDPFYVSSKSASEYRHMMEQYSSRKRLIGAVVSEGIQKRSNKKTKVNNKDAEISSPGRAPAQHPPTSFSEQNILHHSLIQQGMSHKKESPSGMSINWHQLCETDVASTRAVDNVEITIGATGLKRCKKPKHPKDVVNSASRLCRYNLFYHWKECLELSIQAIRCSDKDVKKAALYTCTLRELLDNPVSYMQSKQKLFDLGLVCITEYLFSKREDGNTGLFGGWVRNGLCDDFGKMVRVQNVR